MGSVNHSATLRGMPGPGERVELTVERQVHGGRSLCRLPAGRVALITGAIPGERVLASLEDSKGVLLGEVVEVLTPSPDRREAPRHPGLDLGHVAYERQLQLKREVVEDALRRARGTAVEAPPVTPAPRTWGYRNAVQPAVGNGLGYRRPGTSEIVVLDEDPTASAVLDRAWRTVLEVGATTGGLFHGSRAQTAGTAARPAGAARAKVVEVAFRSNDAGETLLALIGTFEPLDRALLLLYLEERSTREMAEILGIGESNVTTKLSRLKRRIRDHFNPTGG